MKFINDIPASTAQQAFYGTSFDPERRGEQVIKDYANTLQGDYDRFLKGINADMIPILDAEFERYRAGYRDKYLKWLNTRSRCMSTMITGPANYPVRRMNKINDVERKRSQELSDYRTRALDAINKTLHPELRPIMSGDDDATERLEDKIRKAEELQAHYKAINSAHKDYLKNPYSLNKSNLPEHEKERIRAYKPGYSWEPHPIPPYRLTNLSANIRTMKKRLESIARMQTIPETNHKGVNATLEDCPSENRIRLTFPGKPSEEIRSELKRNGFRWTPSLGVWQAYRNHHSIETAKKIAG